MNPTVETLLEVSQERLKLLRGGVLCTCEEDLAVVEHVIDKVDQVSISDAVLWRHQTFQVRTDHAADEVNRRVFAAILPWRRVACLLAFHAGHARHAPVDRETYPECRIARHPLNGVERQVCESLMEMK